MRRCADASRPCARTPLRPTAGCGRKLDARAAHVCRITRKQRRDQAGSARREARDHRSKCVRAPAVRRCAPLSVAPSRLMFLARPSDHRGDRKRCSSSPSSKPSCGRTSTPPPSSVRTAVCCASARDRRIPARVTSRETIAVMAPAPANAAVRMHPSEIRRRRVRTGGLRESPRRRVTDPGAYHPRQRPSESTCDSAPCRRKRCRVRRI